MKMAKARDHDMQVARELVNALEALANRWAPAMPEKIAKPQHDGDEFEGFSLDDDKQCRRVCGYLIRLAQSASLFRVVCGMDVLLDPRNMVVDPGADTLEHHPDAAAGLEARRPRPLADWHEEDGPALWWRFPVEEPPYCGSPNCDDWPGYHTHWTRLIVPGEPAMTAVAEAAERG